MNLHSQDVEASVVGAALLKPDLIDDLSEIVRPDDFATMEYRIIWGAVINMARRGEEIDAITVSEHLEASEILDDVGGLAVISEIARNTPSTDNAATYASIVADLAQRRALIATLPACEAEIAERDKPVGEIVTALQNRLESMRRQDRKRLLRAVEYLGEEFVDPLDRRFRGEEEAMGISYGLRDLDAKTMGMKPNELVIVGGRPSMGKTAFMMNTLRASMDSGKPILVESLEMKRPALFNRLVAGMGSIPIAAFQDPRNNDMDAYWHLIASPIQKIKESDLYINHDTPRTINQIRAQVKEIHDRHGSMGLVMIDYLGKVKVEGDYGQRHDRAIEEVVAGAKAIAKEFSCPVMLLSQLNRKLEDRPNKRPNMGDLKDSSAIEQEADTILFLYRDEVYNKDNPDNKGMAEIIIAKQREGITDTIHVASRLSHARFEDLAPSYYGEETF